MADLTKAVGESHAAAPHQTGFSPRAPKPKAKRRRVQSPATPKFAPVLKYDPAQPRDATGRWTVGDRITALKAKYPVVALNYPRSTHTEMGSIESHTRDVGRQWETQFSQAELQGISDRFGSDVQTLMANAIPLHDIGKAEAIESGAGLTKQHKYSMPILQDVLRGEGHSEKEVALATELLNHDLIGPLFRGYEGFTAHEADVVTALKEKASKVGMNVADFVTLQLAVYQADASAYPYVRQFMRQDPSGKWTFSGRKEIAAIEALQRAHKYDPEQPRDPKGTATGGQFKSEGIPRDEHGVLLDKTGHPLTVYHGSVSREVSGSALNPAVPPVRPRPGQLNGIYFTSDQRVAAGYTRPHRAKIKEKPGRIIAAHLTMQNPLDITDAIKKGQKNGLSFGDAKREALKAVTKDHDGVVFRGDDYNADEYMVFSNTQIRSVKYDPAQPRDPKGSATGGQFTSTGATGRSFTSEEGYQWHEQGPGMKWAVALPQADREELDNYSGFGYSDTNSLRRGTFTPRLVSNFVRAATEAEYEASKVRVDEAYLKEHPHPFGREPYQRLPSEPYERAVDAEGNYLGHFVSNIFYTNPAGEKVRFSLQKPGPDLERLAEVQRKADHLDALIAQRGLVLDEPIVVQRGAYLPGVSAEDLRTMKDNGQTWEEKGFTSTFLGDAGQRAHSYPALGKWESLYKRFGSGDEGMVAHQDEVGTAVRFYITLPKGTKVASIEAVRRLEYEFARIPDPRPVPEGVDPKYWTMTDRSVEPKVKTDNLQKKDTRSESEILLGSGARFKLTKVVSGYTYQSGDPSMKSVPVYEVHMEYIGGGSSDGGTS